MFEEGKRNVNVVVTNPTNSPVVIKKGLILGSVESVSAVVPLGSGDESGMVGCVGVNNVDLVDSEDSVTDLEFDLSHLSDDQRVAALQLLREEKEVFCVGFCDGFEFGRQCSGSCSSSTDSSSPV